MKVGAVPRQWPSPGECCARLGLAPEAKRLKNRLPKRLLLVDSPPPFPGTCLRRMRKLQLTTVMNPIIAKIDNESIRKDLPEFRAGDTVRVHTRVIEGDKERIQIFSGVVIGIRGGGLQKAFTVRRISYGEGVERVFPVHSPRVAKVEVVRYGRARRGKLHYLRGREGKMALFVKEDKSRRAKAGATVATARESDTMTAAESATES